MAGSFVICPIYTKEISDDSIRGALGCLVSEAVELVVSTIITQFGSLAPHQWGGQECGWHKSFNFETSLSLIHTNNVFE